MKKVLSLAAMIGLFAFNAMAQLPKMDKSPADIAYFPANATKRIFAKTEAEAKSLEPKIKIVYSRPAKKDRVIFGGLVEYGKVWRVGANEAADITFYTNVQIGNKFVKAGTYSLFIIPNANNWTIIINKDRDVWGSYAYDQSQDAARITVPVDKADGEIEHFTIKMDDKGNNKAHIVFAWDKTWVELPVTFRKGFW